MQQEIAFFTIVARNYLAYAYVLGDSVTRYHPDARFSIFIMDDISGEYRAEIAAKGFDAITPEQIQIPNYRQFVFKYNVTEASTGVKPFVMQFLLDSGARKLIYLDPDILCFRRFDEVLDALDGDSIVLTPHSTSPIGSEYFPDDHLFLSSGVYNLGFIAVRESGITRRFLDWWCERLLESCLDLTEQNLFVDQKWIDLVPAYFDEVVILKSLAYNIAYWNLHERQVSEQDGRLYVAPSGEPVAFIHFSGMVVDSDGQISKYGPRSPFTRIKKRYSLDDRPDLVAPFKRYGELVLAAGLTRYSAIPYAFNSYSNGEQISQLERSIFYAASRWQESPVDPFAAVDGSFWQACRKAGIRGTIRKRQAAATGSSELGPKYRLVFAAIRLALRIGVRVLGPGLYAKFAKYMRQQLLLINQDFLLKDTRG
jgi:lipopolysaccharide biosynthesis glycosyltransferase